MTEKLPGSAEPGRDRQNDADDLLVLPEGLPVPHDDGAADHLQGMSVPSVRLPSTGGDEKDLSEISAEERTVVYCYPLTGAPGADLPEDWDAIPGARGCTPEACSFRDHHAELRELGVEVFGLSSQTVDYQRELVSRLHLPFEVLSDSDLEFAGRLRLPTFEIEEAIASQPTTLLKRITLVLRDGEIERIFYPVFPPNKHADEVISWLGRNP